MLHFSLWSLAYCVLIFLGTVVVLLLFPLPDFIKKFVYKFYNWVVSFKQIRYAFPLIFCV